jgi:hypothetical protein
VLLRCHRGNESERGNASREDSNWPKPSRRDENLSNLHSTRDWVIYPCFAEMLGHCGSSFLQKWMPGSGMRTFLEADHYEASLRRTQIEILIVLNSKF